MFKPIKMLMVELMKPKIDGFDYTYLKNFCLRKDTMCKVNRRLTMKKNVKELKYLNKIFKIHKKCLQIYQKSNKTQETLYKRGKR